MRLTWDGDSLRYSSSQVPGGQQPTVRLLQAKDPATLEDVQPVIEEGNWRNGTVNANAELDQFIVSKRQYSLK